MVKVFCCEKHPQPFLLFAFPQKAQNKSSCIKFEWYALSLHCSSFISSIIFSKSSSSLIKHDSSEDSIFSSLVLGTLWSSKESSLDLGQISHSPPVVTSLHKSHRFSSTGEEHVVVVESSSKVVFLQRDFELLSEGRLPTKRPSDPLLRGTIGLKRRVLPFWVEVIFEFPEIYKIITHYTNKFGVNT